MSNESNLIESDAALQAGFIISTYYGQEPNQLMPVSDRETLVRFADLIRINDRERIINLLEEFFLTADQLERIAIAIRKREDNV